MLKDWQGFSGVGKGDDGHPAIEYTALSLTHSLTQPTQARQFNIATQAYAWVIC